MRLHYFVGLVEYAPLQLTTPTMPKKRGKEEETAPPKTPKTPKTPDLNSPMYVDYFSMEDNYNPSSERKVHFNLDLSPQLKTSAVPSIMKSLSQNHEPKEAILELIDNSCSALDKDGKENMIKLGYDGNKVLKFNALTSAGNIR